tara:strand:- start:65370 stop:65843 length:474 start_codon:yes stop_codon:yes gene_type:complete
MKTTTNRTLATPVVANPPIEAPSSPYSRIVRASAIYDVLVTFPFALPGLAAWNISQIIALHDSLALTGSTPHFAPFHLFFVNLMGSIVMIWSALRIYKPEPLFGLFDGIARMLFSSWMLYYLLVHNVSGVLWFFIVPESIWGVVQLYGYRAGRREAI